jgi:hypothetical protein
MNDHIAKPLDPDELLCFFAGLGRAQGSVAQQCRFRLRRRTFQQRPSFWFQLIEDRAGVDTQSALKRTGGNPKRYESLLRKLHDHPPRALREFVRRWPLAIPQPPSERLIR